MIYVFRVKQYFKLEKLWAEYKAITKPILLYIRRGGTYKNVLKKGQIYQNY